MVTRDEVKKQAMEILEKLPEEALEEVASYLAMQQERVTSPKANGPTYRPIALGGLWRSTTISDEDIESVRRDMWRRFTETDQ
jgi:hypothetical protein